MAWVFTAFRFYYDFLLAEYFYLNTDFFNKQINGISQYYAHIEYIPNKYYMYKQLLIVIMGLLKV